MNLRATLLTLLPLIVSGCCCCNPLELVPDAVVDSAVDRGVRYGLEQATGVRVEGDQKRFTVSTSEGSMMLGEGAAALDPRIPVSPYPACPISGGARIDADGDLNAGFTQLECTAPAHDVAAHFERQLAALGVAPSRTTITQGGAPMISLTADGDGARFKALAIAITTDPADAQRTNVIVTVQLVR
jgi:hypothetical protein